MPPLSPPGRPPAAERGAEARARLLAAGREAFGTKNLEGATVREIAAAAEQNVASISYHFTSKEGLYHAVLEGIVAELRGRIGPLFAEVEAFRATAKKADPRAALDLLQRLLRTIYLNAMSRDDSLSLGRLIVREQMKPTPAFDLLYQNGLGFLHESLCALVGAILGTPAEAPQTIIRAHSLLGQLYAFCIARETIRRRLGWTTLEGANAEAVAGVLEENLEVLLLGLRSRQRTKAAGRLPKTPLRPRTKIKSAAQKP